MPRDSGNRVNIDLMCDVDGTQITENLIQGKKPLCNKKKLFSRIENFLSITTTNNVGPTNSNKKKLSQT